MEISKKIIVHSDFTETPGARNRADGAFSGEEFFESLLEPGFTKAVEENGLLFIDLDHTWGYASSFISGSFGRLSKKYNDADLIKKHLQFKSDESPLLKEKILQIINDPDKQK